MKDLRQNLEIAVLSGPAIIMFLGFVIFPVVLAAFHAVLMHNGLIVVLSLVMQGPVAIILALLLNRKFRGRSIVRILIFVPYVISEVIADDKGLLTGVASPQVKCDRTCCHPCPVNRKGHQPEGDTPHP